MVTPRPPAMEVGNRMICCEPPAWWSVTPPPLLLVIGAPEDDDTSTKDPGAGALDALGGCCGCVESIPFITFALLNTTWGACWPGRGELGTLDVPAGKMVTPDDDGLLPGPTMTTGDVGSCTVIAWDACGPGETDGGIGRIVLMTVCGLSPAGLGPTTVRVVPGLGAGRTGFRLLPRMIGVGVRLPRGIRVAPPAVVVMVVGGATLTPGARSWSSTLDLLMDFWTAALQIS